MGKKRDLYRGTVEKRGKNTWRIRVSLGWDKAEKKYVRSPSRTVHGTKAQAYEALEKYKAEIRDGADLVFEADITVDKYAQMFHAERKDIMNSPLAYEREGLEVGKIADLFEDCLFDDLSAFYIRQRYNAARKGGMSQSELHKVHTKFKQILQQATEDRLIPYNPCQSISVPRPEPKDNRNSLTKEEAQALLAKLKAGEEVAEETLTATFQALQAALIGGETAEMPGFYPEEEYDLAGFAVGIVDQKDLITGENLQPGDVLLGMASSGVHSNGFSLVRKVFEMTKKSLDTYYDELGETLGEALLAPTRIYVRALKAVKDAGVTVKACSHITGGGFYENVPRMLREGTRAVIHKDSYEVPAIFRLLPPRMQSGRPKPSVRRARRPM